MIMEKIRDYILSKEILEIRAISMINKTTSTLFRNQKGLMSQSIPTGYISPGQHPGKFFE